MNIKRLLNTQLGQMFISIFLGIGLATLFRKVCKDKDCINFNGPVISEIEDKTYKYNDKCYKYDITPTICNEDKRILNIVEPKIEPMINPNNNTDTKSNISYNEQSPNNRYKKEYLENLQNFIGL